MFRVDTQPVLTSVVKVPIHHQWFLHCVDESMGIAPVSVHLIDAIRASLCSYPEPTLIRLSLANLSANSFTIMLRDRHQLCPRLYKIPKVNL
jgi:hypothetical protein